MKQNFFKLVLALAPLAVYATSARAETPKGPCDEQATTAAKAFAEDDGDEACARDLKSSITEIRKQRKNKELIYFVHVDCGGGTSFDEMVLLTASCKVLNSD